VRRVWVLLWRVGGGVDGWQAVRLGGGDGLGGSGASMRKSDVLRRGCAHKCAGRGKLCVRVNGSAVEKCGRVPASP
jgi:hypothetical protein